MFSLLLNNRASKPFSHSLERSGLRLELPSAAAKRPGVSVPVAAVGTEPRLTVGALNVWRPVVDPGCTPEAPNALRRRSWLRKSKCGKKLSSEMIHERLAFG